MVTYTTTYNLKKPTVADDEDVWGGYLNDSMDLIDDVLDGTTPVTGIDINSGTVDNVVVGGTTAVAGTFTVLTANTSLGVTGNITVSGTVDGRDVAADGTKLDGVESGATADQTKADIDALGIAATTASTLATARNIAVTGAVTGSTSFDGSGNVSISTTATADPTLTLSGDASGSATFTNLGNATLSVTVADDSHNHVISNVDGLQTALNAKYDASNPNGYTTYTANQSLNTSNSPSFAGLNINGNLNAVDDIYLADQIFHEGDTDTYMQFNAANTWRVVTAGSQRLVVNSSGVGLSNGGLDMNGNNITEVANIYLAGTLYHEGDTDTYLSFNTTDTISLRTGGTDRIYINNTGVRIGDTGNGYFRPVSGNYGSIEIDGGAHGGWEGYSIGGRVVFMHDNNVTSGIYNDVNNEWMVKTVINGGVSLYHNNAIKIATDNSGALIYGNLYTTGSVAEDYDALSGTSPTCNVDNAGAFSLTMSGNTTFTFSGADNNYSMGFILQLTGNGSTVTWPSSVDWAGGTAPDAPASGESNLYVFWTRDGGSNWHGVLSSAAYA